MPSALVIGGTGFVGWHTAMELRDHDYEVTVFSRGARDESIPQGGVSTLVGNRRDREELETAAEAVAPDTVVDCALFHPNDARVAIEVFGDVDAYVYVSSGGVYARNDIPKRESATPLHEFDANQANDDSMATYGPRKAECDRIIRAAGERGVAAMCVRPTMIYGPKATGAGSVSWAPDMPGVHEHHDYWIDRVNRFDRVVVPGDGTAIWHRVYVKDVASAIRVVSEDGTPGQAYNVADRRVLTIEDVIDLIVEALDTSVDVVHASRRELERFDLSPEDFVLYHHMGYNYPHVLSTCKLSTLSWQSTPPQEAMERTVEESLESDRDGSAFDPGRAAEERLIDAFAE